MASLTLKNITKAFGTATVLSHVDLAVEDGTFCVLLGPSGCGKSTLLNIIAGLVRQDEGTVFLDNHPVDHLSPRERDIAFVFQSYALYPHMTVAQNLSFGLRMRRASQETVHNRVEEAASLLGIEELLNRKPRDLSGGQRQRVAMGRALVRRPRLFLMDEPLSNLDARLRAKVRLELKQLHRRIRGTILYVTHDQVEAMTLGDSVVVMRDGKIHQVGAPETIYGTPADTFVATFIGTPEINLYRGELVVQAGMTVFQGRGFAIGLENLCLDGSEKDVELGIRPEDIHIRPGAQSGLTGTVEMISDMGSERFVHARIGEENVTVRAPKEIAFRTGEAVPLSVDAAHIHLFFNGRRRENNLSC